MQTIKAVYEAEEYAISKIIKERSPLLKKTKTSQSPKGHSVTSKALKIKAIEISR